MRDFDPTATEFISSGFLVRSMEGVRYDVMSIASVAAPVVGGIFGSDAAGDAAAAQERAAEKSDATQRYMYDTTRADNAPFLANGTAASNRLAYLLGLAPNPTGGAAAAASAPVDRNAIRSRLLSQFTTTAGGGVPQYGSGEEANRIISYSAPTSTVDEVGLNAAIDREVAAQQASQLASTQGAQAAANNDPEFGSLMRRFSLADLNADPVYQTGLQFGLDEGTKAINRQAAATGSALSGATLKALTRFGNDYGTTKAGDAYNRFTNDQTLKYNRLAGVAGSGQTASAQVGSAGANAANNISQSQQAVGNSRAAGYVGSANALGGGFAGAANNYQNNQLLNRIFPSPGYSGSTGYTGGADPLGSFIASKNW